jgi:glycosyltransferase involved in cell wall biosynthesis
MAKKIQVTHLMRTYGTHGGEQQLSQYFGAEPRGEVSETFVFLYRDPPCARLFASRAPRLKQLELFQWPLATGTAWREFTMLLLLLPWLQFRFFALAWRLRPAVVVVHGFQAAFVAWPAAILFRGIRWVYLHRITKSATGSNGLFHLIYQPYDVIAGNSQAVAASLEPVAGKERLATIDNGLDWRRFDARTRVPLAPLPEAAGLVLVSVGRLLPHKGQAMLIDAFERMAGRFPHAVLWVAGEGPEMKSLRRRTGASPAGSRIHLLGHREDVPAVLARADVFVNTSAWEGMSNAVLEGMAAGLPAVVCDAPGVTECHIDGVTALVVKRDPGDLATALARLLGDAELRRRMGAAARERAKKNYSMEANRRRYLEVFGRLTGRDVCAEF